MALVLPPGVRTFKPRRSRITPRQRRGLTDGRRFALPLHASASLRSVWNDPRPVILDIGFGDGDATFTMAQADPTKAIIAIDVHTPGVGNLLALLSESQVDNVRVIEGDALVVLNDMTADAELAGIRTYFADPWPKARHHKRRFVQPAVVDLVAQKLEAGGYWHIATDWPEYAEHIAATFTADRRWSGGVIERPSWRPLTRYEQRGIGEGRPIVDFVFYKQRDEVEPPALSGRLT